MNSKYLVSLTAVVLLFIISYFGAQAAGLKVLFGILIPYAAFIVFVGGFVYKILNWAASPAPFRIPSTCGQQKSLSFIKRDCLDNPFYKWEVVIRMALEILFFRSLFRNTKFELEEGNKFSFRWEKWLWLFALLFHWAFLGVIIRHFRFFLEPVPFCIQFVEYLDSFFRVEYFSNVIQVGLPGVFISGIMLLVGVSFLLIRRLLSCQVNYISLAADYFPLFLIIGIALTGIFMRYFSKIDIVAVKELTMGLVTFRPVIPKEVGAIFYAHVFLVSVLLAYFPFSKLMHMGGIFLSPTRNLPGNSRAERHVNPWNYPVKVHTYEEYEEEFREKMIEAGLPVEKGGEV